MRFTNSTNCQVLTALLRRKETVPQFLRASSFIDPSVYCLFSFHYFSLIILPLFYSSLRLHSLRHLV